MKRITENPYTTVIGFVLIGTALVASYLEIDSSICTIIATAGVGLVASKDNWFKP